MLGRRIGEVERPRARTVMPLLVVPCDGKGGGREGFDPMETAELPGKICLEEPLSGMLDKCLRPSSDMTYRIIIADEKVISEVPSSCYRQGSYVST